MKPIDAYKDAVMHRVEEKTAAHKRSIRRVLTVCIPLCLCLAILAAVALPRALYVGEDYVAPEMSGNADDETDHSADAAVVRDGTAYPVDDADAFYETVLALFETKNTTASNSNSGLPGGISVDESLGDSYYENAGQESTHEPCYLQFHREDGLHEFYLQNHVLTDLANGESVTLTYSQASSLINGEAPADSDYEYPSLYSTPSSYDAVQWFPCREGFERDDLWEVQTDGDYCQRFTETVEDTGNANLLDTVFDEDGRLTITRNEVASSSSPFIRTLPFEIGPTLNIRNGNVLHIDFEATADWSIKLTFYSTQTVSDYHGRDTVYTEYPIDLSRAITKACDRDGGAGRYTTTLELEAVLQMLADEGDEAATAVLAMDTVMLPHLQIDCLGDTGSSLTMHKFLYSSADDLQGEQCYYMCMDVMLGDYIPRNGLPTAMRRTTVSRTTTTAVTTTTTATTTITSTTANPDTAPTTVPACAPWGIPLLILGGVAVAVMIGMVIRSRQ